MDVWSFRSAVLATHGVTVSDQPLVSDVGLDVLKSGGNAADSMIAMMAVMGIIQPMLCGPGGDTNVMFYRKSDQRVLSINGSGRTGEFATLQKLHEAGIFNYDDVEHSKSGLFISVPGTIAALFKIHQEFGSGKLSIQELLEPAIQITEGVPLPFKTGRKWQLDSKQYINSRHAKSLLLKNGLIPGPGDIFRAPELAGVYKDIIANGPEAFYENHIAARIIDEVEYAGGVLTLDDMKNHLQSSINAEPNVPLFIYFKGFYLWEMKPNTIGVVALVTANILKGFDLKALGHNSAEYIHIVSEALKIAFEASWDYLADPAYIPGSPYNLLTKETTEKLRKKIHMDRAIPYYKLISGGDTTYLAAVDAEGNACSLIFSVSDFFGSGQIPKNCGFVLHNRAKYLSLNKSRTNAFGPSKLPLHSLIPAMLTNAATGELEAIFGVVGSWMQPQGHIQVLLNMVIFGMDPQVSLNQPRFLLGEIGAHADEINTFNQLHLEEGINPDVIPVLRSKGHSVSDDFVSGHNRIFLGRGHIIAKPTVWNPYAPMSHQVWWAGCDPRTDGAPRGY